MDMSGVTADNADSDSLLAGPENETNGLLLPSTQHDPSQAQSCSTYGSARGVGADCVRHGALDSQGAPKEKGPRPLL